MGAYPRKGKRKDKNSSEMKNKTKHLTLFLPQNKPNNLVEWCSASMPNHPEFDTPPCIVFLQIPSQHLSHQLWEEGPLEFCVICESSGVENSISLRSNFCPSPIHLKIGNQSPTCPLQITDELACPSPMDRISRAMARCGP